MSHSADTHLLEGGLRACAVRVGEFPTDQCDRLMDE